MLGINGTFDPSSGWLKSLKKIHGIRETSSYDEKLIWDEEIVEHFKDDFEKFLQSGGVSYEQVYCADESGLLWKYLPTRTLTFEWRNQPTVHKYRKECLLILTCSEARAFYKLNSLSTDWKINDTEIF